MFGRMYSERMGLLTSFAVFIGFVLTFFPQFLLGNAGMPRRYFSYPPRYQWLHVLSTGGAWLLSAGALLLTLAEPAGRAPLGRARGPATPGARAASSGSPPRCLPSTTSPRTAVDHAPRALRLPRSPRTTAQCMTDLARAVRRPRQAGATPRASGCGLFSGAKRCSLPGCSRSTRLTGLCIPSGFAEGVAHNDAHLGTLNTFVLLTSSFLVALAVHEGRLGRGTRAGFLLVSSIALGIAFLIIKFIEYGHHFAEGIEPWDPAMTREHGSRISSCHLLRLTGLHAVHVTLGMAVLTWLATLAFRHRFSPARHTALELGALYWHLVDIVWIFLWPCLYLMR